MMMTIMMMMMMMNTLSYTALKLLKTKNNGEVIEEPIHIKTTYLKKGIYLIHTHENVCLHIKDWICEMK